MAWDDRLIPAVYISPSGIPFTFLYENVSVETDKKTATFVFPEINGAFIQDLGRAGRRFPLVLFFSGEDHDIISDAFRAAVEEKGIGTLIHPRYGIKQVVPTGTITQRDDLVTGANQTAFSITFSETLTGLTFPSSIENVITQMKTAYAVFQQATSLQFADDIILNTANEIVSIQEKFDLQRFVIEDVFQNIIKVSEDVFTAFQTVNNSLKENISEIADFPDIVGSQLITLMRIPTQTDITINEKIDLYNGIINTELQTNYSKLQYANEPNNLFVSATLQVYSALQASCESVLIGEIKTRQEAIVLSEKILDSFDSIQTWVDDNIRNLESIDTGQSYSSLIEAVTITIVYLIDLAFELPSEKFLILDEERNIIELVSELYQDLDQLDFFITSNNLTCDEIEILPQGKEVVYYV
jgi:hypothetical protein